MDGSLVGRTFLYPTSVGRQKEMDTMLVGWLMVMKCACESVKVEGVQIWTVFWRTDVRNVFDVTNRNSRYILVKRLAIGHVLAIVERYHS